MDVSVNYFAILLAAASSMLVGFFWYSPSFFGKPWMKLMGYTAKSMEASKDNMSKTYAITFLGSLVMAYVLAHSLIFASSYTKVSGFSGGLMAGFWSWAGFVLPVQVNDALFGAKPWLLVKINTGYQLVSLLLMGVILSYLG
jgi:hypothetical protein